MEKKFKDLQRVRFVCLKLFSECTTDRKLTNVESTLVVVLGKVDASLRVSERSSCEFVGGWDCNTRNLNGFPCRPSSLIRTIWQSSRTMRTAHCQLVLAGLTNRWSPKLAQTANFLLAAAGACTNRFQAKSIRRRRSLSCCTRTGKC